MKKIIIALAFLFAASLTFAQTTPVKATKTSPVVKTTSTTKIVAKASTTGLKKDGTPDMRLKQNKMKTKTATPAGPLKKDSTPDMRYKANKKK